MRHSKTALQLSTFLPVIVIGLVFSFSAAAKMYRPPASFSHDVAALESVDLRVMAPVDNARLLTAAKRREAELPATPLHIAHPVTVELDTAGAGHWEELADGSRLWRLRISSPGAVHLSLGFGRFDLPPGAGLWIYDPALEHVEGPYTARHRSHRGRLFTPLIPGSEIVVELQVPAGAGALDLALSRVHHGYRDIVKGLTSGSCNIDVICPEGNRWRDHIRSVARYTINGITLCTGQLVNNTAHDDRPFFLSAFHCGVNNANDDSIVTYWNYESPTCGQRGGGSLANTQTGASFRAGEINSDFLLVELSELPDPDFDAYFTGWDISGLTPRASVGIHHPSGDVKAISFNDDSLTMDQWEAIPDSHWRIEEWEQGTTEGGSSGSCLWDPDTQLCVGVLTAGRASCSAPNLYDIYGKLSLAWDVGPNPSSRLRDWLDPLGLGVDTLPGRNPGDPPPPPPPPPGDCVSSDTTLCLDNSRFQVEVSRTTADAGEGPARIVPLTVRNDESGLFYFFNPENWEMLVKVLNGCVINDHFWVFAASATDVEWTITVTDTETDTVKTYEHPLGSPSEAVTDTTAFATCP